MKWRVCCVGEGYFAKGVLLLRGSLDPPIPIVETRTLREAKIALGNLQWSQDCRNWPIESRQLLVMLYAIYRGNDLHSSYF